MPDHQPPRQGAARRGATIADDGIARCPWGTQPREYREYHDQEWGRPTADENKTYEKLCLEGFQSGLSWLTILRKRAAFRTAFSDFDPAIVAGFDEGDVERLLTNSAIVRHRGKIEAAIANARAVLALWAEGTTLAELVWSYEAGSAEPQVPKRRSSVDAPAYLEDLPAATAQSLALGADLRRKGFRFVGPTTVYSTMQALGVVNDHLVGCHFHEVVAQERARFVPPRRS